MPRLNVRNSPSGTNVDVDSLDVVALEADTVATIALLGKVAQSAVASDISLTVEGGMFEAGDWISLERGSTGEFTIIAGGGMAINVAASKGYKLTEQYSPAFLRFDSPHVATLSGDLTS